MSLAPQYSRIQYFIAGYLFKSNRNSQGSSRATLVLVLMLKREAELENPSALSYLESERRSGTQLLVLTPSIVFMQSKAGDVHSLDDPAVAFP